MNARPIDAKFRALVICEKEQKELGRGAKNLNKVENPGEGE
jgi:hypothetical protein